MSHGPDDSPVQWSPDGRWIALSLAVTFDRRLAAALSVQLVDAESGQVVTRLPGNELCGPASWSPSGNRLLLRAGTTGICTYDLHTEQVEPVALMSGRQQQPWLLVPGGPWGWLMSTACTSPGDRAPPQRSAPVIWRVGPSSRSSAGVTAWTSPRSSRRCQPTIGSKESTSGSPRSCLSRTGAMDGGARPAQPGSTVRLAVILLMARSCRWSNDCLAG